MSITRAAAVLSSASGLRTYDIADEIFAIQPQRKVLLTLLTAMRRKRVESRKFTVNTRSMDPAYVTVTVVDSTTITVSDADCNSVIAGMIVRADESNATFVESVDYDANTFVVAAATGISVGTKLILAGRNRAEGSTIPTALTRSVDQVDNYLSCLRDAWGQSRWQETERHYGPVRQRENRKLALEEHGFDCDRNLWMSVSVGASKTLSSAAIFSSNGVMATISSNSHGFDAGVVTFEQMLDFAAADGKYMPSDVIWGFTSRETRALIHKVCYGKVDIAVSKQFGINVMSIVLGDKTVNLYTCHHFVGNLQDDLVLIDPKLVSIATSRNQETGKEQWMLEETDARTPGQDGSLGCITTDIGLHCESEVGLALWKDMSTAYVKN